jgi:hypothetical protein
MSETCSTHWGIIYCDMMPDRRNCAVREAPQRRRLLDSRSLDTFPQQRKACGNQSVDVKLTHVSVATTRFSEK